MSLLQSFSCEPPSNRMVSSTLNCLSILVKLSLSLSFLFVCWSTASQDHNGSLTSSSSLSINLMKSAKPGSLGWFFQVNCTLLFHLPFVISSFKIKIQSKSGLLNKFQFLPSVRPWHLIRKLSNFQYAITSACLICGYFLISSWHVKKILWGSPCCFISRFFAFS